MAFARIAPEMTDIRRVLAPAEQVTTLQRVVTGLEPRVGSLEGQYQNFQIRQAGVIERVDRTAGLLDERNITIRGTTSHLTYCEQTLRTALKGITFLERGTDASSGLGTPSLRPEPASEPPPSYSCSGSDGCCPWCASKGSSFEDANKALGHKVARLNTQVVDLRGQVSNQREDTASWKAEVMREMRVNLEGFRRQNLEEIRDCRRRLILAESESDRLKVEVVDRLARKVHHLDRQCASLKRQIQQNSQELALVKGRQQMPGPATPSAPDVSTSLNLNLTAVENGVAEHNASLWSLNA